ncbi:hypothetical protein Ahy_B05g076385 [Arachis hypogaea]|uniref:FAR1 domain-containing protein n=1 Tax=Arachis hypogaea TaxID=3818 RepID=A0A444Z3J4_ARAHY|nr:hypothetical protein Ahy_B05g076385 [Arachis hypogaea]
MWNATRLDSKKQYMYTYEEFNRAEEGGAVANDECCKLEDLAGLSVDDILKKVWVSIENAYEFYRRFGKMHGFGVQKGDSRKDCEGNLVRYRYFCNKEGLRERKYYDRVDRTREHKPETRTNCKAMLSVRKLVTEHNHELTPEGMVHLIANHCGLTEIVKS